MTKNIDTTARSLETKEAQLLFNAVWSEVEPEVMKNKSCFPKEIFWLNGAPGAGKGTHTEFIKKYRDFRSDASFGISDLLQSESARKLKDQGVLVGDHEVFKLLLNKLMEPQFQKGVIVDGFPRTFVQVECLKLLFNKLHEISTESKDSESSLSKPRFHIVVLYIDEDESAKRQLHRGKESVSHNERVATSGEGELHELRKTDTCEDAARDRYRTFKQQTYDPLKTLADIFPYHFINAHGKIDSIREKIVEELKYQSSLELSELTYNQLKKVPILSKVIKHSRQDLVERLDDYQSNHTKLFEQVIELIINNFMPIIERHAISGKALINTEDPILENKKALSMLIDIFSDRGFQATVDIHKQHIPESIDLSSGIIKNAIKRIYRVHISFPTNRIRLN